MRTPRSPRLTRATAEELLDGHGPDLPLTWLLAAATAPGRAEEIAGEAAARAAFTAAGSASTPPVRPPKLRQGFLPRLLAAKAVTLILLAAGATGGVALAASTPFARAPDVADRPTSAPAAPPPAAAPALASAGPSAPPTVPFAPPVGVSSSPSGSTAHAPEPHPTDQKTAARPPTSPRPRPSTITRPTAPCSAGTSSCAQHPIDTPAPFAAAPGSTTPAAPTDPQTAASQDAAKPRWAPQRGGRGRL